MRPLQRYCANGTLECVREATETGNTYSMVEGASVCFVFLRAKEVLERRANLIVYLSDRLGGEMSIALGGLRLGVTQELPD